MVCLSSIPRTDHRHHSTSHDSRSKCHDVTSVRGGDAFGTGRSVNTAFLASPIEVAQPGAVLRLLNARLSLSAFARTTQIIYFKPAYIVDVPCSSAARRCLCEHCIAQRRTARWCIGRPRKRVKGQRVLSNTFVPYADRRARTEIQLIRRARQREAQPPVHRSTSCG
jgi:hypothetical protein